MAHSNRPSLIPTMAWSLAILLAMGIFFALLVGPALTGRGGVDGHGYLPPTPPDDLTEYAPVKSVQAPGIDLARAVAGDPALESWARDEYGKICTACHGQDGRGDGPAGLALKARNFTVKDAWKNGPKLTQIFRTLSKGLPPMMPSYDTYGSAQRLALAHVVQGFMGFPVPADSPAEVAALDTEYSLSAGVREPGRVPVRIAQDLVVAEARPARLKAGALPEDLRHLVLDEQRTGQVVAGLRGGGLAATAAALTAGAPANGFSPSLGTLSGADWQRLISALPAALDVPSAGIDKIN